MLPSITIIADGSVRVSWKAIRGMYHKVQKSPDLVTWTDATTSSISYTNGAIPGDANGTWVDNSPSPGREFYRIVRSTAP
jgi:hypothetical protein